MVYYGTIIRNIRAQKQNNKLVCNNIFVTFNLIVSFSCGGGKADEMRERQSFFGARGREKNFFSLRFSCRLRLWMSCNRKKQLFSPEKGADAPWVGWLEEGAEGSGEKDGRKKFVYENIMCVMCFLAFYCTSSSLPAEECAMRRREIGTQSCHCGTLGLVSRSNRFTRLCYWSVSGIVTIVHQGCK